MCVPPPLPSPYIWLLSLCRYITMMPKLRQSLVEFEKVEDAIACVTHCQVCVGHVQNFIYSFVCFKNISVILCVIPVSFLFIAKSNIHHGSSGLFQLFYQLRNHKVKNKTSNLKVYLLFNKVLVTFTNARLSQCSY